METQVCLGGGVAYAYGQLKVGGGVGAGTASGSFLRMLLTLGTRWVLG